MVIKSIFNSEKKIDIYFYYFCSNDPEDNDIVLPEELATIIRIALSKMVAAKCLNPTFVNLDFWRRIPGKFRGIRLYEDKKTKIKEVCSLK